MFHVLNHTYPSHATQVSFDPNGDRLAAYQFWNKEPDGEFHITGMFHAATNQLELPGADRVTTASPPH